MLAAEYDRIEPGVKRPSGSSSPLLDSKEAGCALSVAAHQYEIK